MDITTSKILNCEGYQTHFYRFTPPDHIIHHHASFALCMARYRYRNDLPKLYDAMVERGYKPVKVINPIMN